MNSSSDFAQWLAKEMNQRGLSAKDLADIAGVSRSNISLILNNKGKPGFDFCKAVAQAFGLPTIYVLRLAGLIEDEEQASSPTWDELTLTQILDIMRNLSPEQRRQVLDFAQFLYRRGEEES